MHISLDSALGQQRRLNQVGESITQIAPDPAAAYSLRSLTGGDPKVVRVRRGSDNHEQDFTASEVSSGALVDFVNAQVVAPLDIQALSATGRDGDFLIAKAAYSLRSLGTRQATVAATGDTVARADGKFVCQVRRSSDDALKSFTADEITDGTLLSFVGTSGSDNGFVKTWYDQSVTTQAGDTATGNHATQATAAEQPKIVDAGALNNNEVGKPALKLDKLKSFALTSEIDLSSNFSIFGLIDADSDDSTGYRDGSDNPLIGRSGTNLQTFGIGTDSAGSATDMTIRFTGSPTTVTEGSIGAGKSSTRTFIYNGSTVSGFDDGSLTDNQITASGTLQINQLFARRDANDAFETFDGTTAELIIYDTNQTDNRTAIEANIGEVYSIDLPSGVDPGFDQVDGFVETWYDQSGNGKDATQATASDQPKIVSAGALNADGGLLFDSSEFDLGSSVSLGSAHSIFAVAKTSTAVSGVLPNFLTNPTNGRGIGFYSDAIKDKAIVSDNANNNLTFSSNTNKKILSLTSDASNVNGFQNGTASSDNSKSQTLTNNNFTEIGGGSNFAGTIEEIIVYLSDQTANRVALETNINGHYSIF